MDLRNCMPVLFVKNAIASRNFYRDVLEMTEIMNSGDLNFAFKEGFAIWQILEQNEIPRKLGMDNITDSKAVVRSELAFETGDIDTVFGRLIEAGVTFLHEINTEIWGQRNLRFYDPDGHLIEVGEAMPVFLARIFEEEGKDWEATSKRTYMPVEVLKKILEGGREQKQD